MPAVRQNSSYRLAQILEASSGSQVKEIVRCCRRCRTDYTPLSSGVPLAKTDYVLPHFESGLATGRT
jgi:hypothetical protein